MTGPAPEPVTRKPMCDAWYERAGNYRPWHAWVEGCMCGVTAHHLPRQHGAHCPVFRYWQGSQEQETGT